MRQLTLYIDGNKVDMDNQSFILLNYALEDLSNPTIVKNTYSQSITLPGTERNNKIFGGIYRLDHRVSVEAFNPSIKTPFEIYDTKGKILESGYIRMDSITRNHNAISYKVTLFGGLGSFFYSLSYDSEGNKKTLASLDFLGSGNADSELDFNITKEAVQEAWDELMEDEPSGKWSVINFAPAYNGIPDTNFAADKGIVRPSDIGLANSVVVDGTTYGLKNNRALVSLANPQEEWAVKDLRSYLQRPALSMKALWKALERPGNNGGFTFDASALYDSMGNIWMTLPFIPSISVPKTSGNLSLSFGASRTPSITSMGAVQIVGNVPSGTKVTTSFSIKPIIELTQASDDIYTDEKRILISTQYQTLRNIIFAQAVAYGSDGTMVGGSNVVTNYPATSADALASFAEDCGFLPKWNPEELGYKPGAFGTWGRRAGTNDFVYDHSLTFEVEATDVAYYEIYYKCYKYSKGASGAESITETTSAMEVYGTTDVRKFASSIEISSGGNYTISYESGESLRSGALITKKMLLSTEYTPAEYLLSFCKMFGFYFKYDSVTKSVEVVKRGMLYRNTRVDLTNRIDKSFPISIKPLAFDAKWYNFNQEGVGGAFESEYKTNQGIDYGIKRVNTGYDFNADSRDLLETNVFKSAVTILDKSRYYNTITDNGRVVPSPFIDKGNKYTLWNSSDETTEVDISCPGLDAIVEYWNEYGHTGYDIEFARKIEFRDKDHKPLTGDNVLMYLEGWDSYYYHKLSDDTPAMGVLNDGVPCWDLTPGDGVGIDVPIFGRYTYSNNWTIDHALDFGVPKELGIPDVRYPESATIYYKRWQNYLRDRYDVNTKVMTCKVDLTGIDVSQVTLLDNYYYDGSLWALNAIKNYSLTTQDPVECEFIQVQDLDNYINGQDE